MGQIFFISNFFAQRATPKAQAKKPSTSRAPHYQILSLGILAWAFPLLLHSAKIISPLPLPQTEIINLSTEACNTRCLQESLNKGEIFSFLAQINENNQNQKLSQELQSLLTQLDIQALPYQESLQKPSFRIALLFPRKSIGRYSASTTNVILAYLLGQNNRFDFEIFDSQSELEPDLQSTLQTIQSKGYDHIIALVTYAGANVLNQIQSKAQIYIPSVHSSQINGEIAANLIFGGINYEEQIKLLSQFDQESPTISFYNGGFIGLKIEQYTQNYNPNLLYALQFNDQQASNFPKNIKGLTKILNQSKIFLNTPITHSSIILSQITYNKIKPKSIYSTQINYHPSFFSLTQPKDRQNMFIANSIARLDLRFIEEARLVDADLEYDWINYSTALGLEYFYTKNIPNTKRFFKESIQNNQVQYHNIIMTPAHYRFEIAQ